MGLLAGKSWAVVSVGLYVVEVDKSFLFLIYFAVVGAKGSCGTS
jgi:hypothetical protein